MKIVIFGSKKCKFCKQLISNIKNTFLNKNLIYLDVFKEKKILKIAKEVKVINIPTTIIFDEKWNPTFKKEGIVSCDLLFSKIYGNKSIPIGKQTEKMIKEKKITSCLLSEKRNFSIGDIVSVVKYNNKEITKVKILSADNISFKYAKNICNQKVIREYEELGGRKDWVQMIVFGI